MLCLGLPRHHDVALAGDDGAALHHLQEPRLINNPLYLPLVLPNIFGVAYFIFLMRQFFMSIPEELSEAARIEGASEFGRSSGESLRR